MMTAPILIAALFLGQPEAGVWREGPVTVRVQPAPERGVIALPAPDELKVEIRVEGSGKLEVHPPAKWIVTRGWRMHPPAPAKIETTEDGKRVWSVVLDTYPISPGEFKFQLAPLAWKDGEVGGEAKFAAIDVRSFSTLDRADLRDLRDPVTLDRLPAGPRSLPWTNLLLTGVGVTVGLYLALRGIRKRPAETVSAELRALRSLDRVRQWRLPEKGKTERHFTLLSLIARRYLERKHDLPARHRTTPEFLRLLESRADLANEHAFIIRFFERADLAKFGPPTATAEECLAVERELRAWLESAYKRV